MKLKEEQASTALFHDRENGDTNLELGTLAIRTSCNLQGSEGSLGKERSRLARKGAGR
jgi:hypothetical protein